MKQKIALIIPVLILLLGSGWVVWKLWISPEPMACTEEAKICSDGSAVGRTGPNCEFAPCPGETGTIAGRVSVGPLCPVEPCDADPLDFSSNQIILESQFGQKTTIDLTSDGSFSSSGIAPGIYQVTLKDCVWLGCASVLPKTVSVSAGQTTEVPIDIDTGIR
jgi:hypothetical protein